MNDIDAHFIQRIAVFENDILSTSLDHTFLNDFTPRWTTFSNDVRTAIDAKSLKSSTITRAHALASRVSTLIQTFLQLEVLSERLMASLLDESPNTFHPPTPTVPAAPPGTSVIPSYIRPSHQWLLDNLHDPYPSPLVRDSIANKSGAARKDVDNWFIDARKRIGWNTLRKKHFHNKRSEIVAAATAYYIKDNDHRPLDSIIEYEFIAIQKKTTNLYSDKFDKSSLAATLDAAVKNLTPRFEAEARVEQLRQRQMETERDAYPSPDRSPRPTCLSPVRCNDDEADDVSQSISTSRKRRNASSDALDANDGQAKRLRVETPSPPVKDALFPTGLPSPASSTDESLQTTEPLNTNTLYSSVGRKRRLSESGDQTASKRPRIVPGVPRLQVTSNPSPSGSNLFDDISFDGWFQQSFNHPMADQISPSGISVELGDLSDFNCETSAESCSTSPGALEHALQPPIIGSANSPLITNISWNEFDFGWVDNLIVPSFATSHSPLISKEPLPIPLTQDVSNYQTSQNSISDLDSCFSLPNQTIVNSTLDPFNRVASDTWTCSESSLAHDDLCNFGEDIANFEDPSLLLSSFAFTEGKDALLPLHAIRGPTLTPSQNKVRQEKEKEFQEACEKAQRLALELHKGEIFPL